MTSSTDLTIIKETLEFSISEDTNVQDLLYFLMWSAMNPFARRAVADFMLKNFDTVCDLFAYTII